MIFQHYVRLVDGIDPKAHPEESKAVVAKVKLYLARFKIVGGSAYVGFFPIVRKSCVEALLFQIQQFFESYSF